MRRAHTREEASPRADPWTGPDPDDTSLDPRDPLIDPFASPPGRPGAPRFNPSAFGFTIMKHACNRMAKCGNTDAMLQSTCSALDSIVPTSPAPNCAAAQRCLDHVDQLDCATPLGAADMGMLMMKLQDCSDAVLRC